MEAVAIRVVNLRDLLDELPVERVQEILSTFSCPLNARGVDAYLDGAKLLKIACSKVAEIQREFSGKLVYIECEGEPKLIRFYERNGFRITEKAQQPRANELIQMIRYL